MRPILAATARAHGINRSTFVGNVWSVHKTLQLITAQRCLSAVGALRAVGSIPPAVGGLTSLRRLDLHNNQLSGEWGFDELCFAFRHFPDGV